MISKEIGFFLALTSVASFRLRHLPPSRNTETDLVFFHIFSLKKSLQILQTVLRFHCSREKIHLAEF